MGTNNDTDGPRDTVGLVLTIPTSLSIEERNAIYCIRSYYVQQWAAALQLRNIDFLGVAPAYDKPDRGYCVWYDIYKFAKYNLISPLWAIDYLIRKSQITTREININSTMNKDLIPTFKEHGDLLHRDKIVAVNASIKHLLTSVPLQRHLANMTLQAAVVDAVSRAGSDAVVACIAQTVVGVTLDRSAVILARLSYALTPEAYLLPEDSRKALRLVNYFPWAKTNVCVDGVDLIKLTQLSQ